MVWLWFLRAMAPRNSHCTPTAKVRTQRTISGEEILTPLDCDRCWNAPLPCTLFFRPSLIVGRDASGRIRSFSLPADEPAAP